jgi:hypothetical protein
LATFTACTDQNPFAICSPASSSNSWCPHPIRLPSPAAPAAKFVTAAHHHANLPWFYATAPTLPIGCPPPPWWRPRRLLSHPSTASTTVLAFLLCPGNDEIPSLKTLKSLTLNPQTLTGDWRSLLLEPLKKNHVLGSHETLCVYDRA